jgi:two-component system chemotaxis response regulator CheY
VVGKAKDGGEAVQLYGELKPDAVTMDVTMRGKDGITAALEILAKDPAASIIFYTLLDTPRMTAQIEKVPVKGVVRKGDEQNLLQVLERIG